MDREQVHILLDRYLAGTCSQQEQQQVEAWLEQQEMAVNEWATMDTRAKAAWMASLYQDMRQQSVTSTAPLHEQPRVMPFYRRPFFRVAAAAIVILLIGSVIYLYYDRSQKNEAVIAENEHTVLHDVAPGGNKAILTLADNSTIILDSAANGKLAEQGSSVVNKTKDGQLKYDSVPAKAGANRQSAISYNTLSTPRGGQYQLVLPDGSKVWLNAASSIRYPTAFTGDERKVEIKGEAYFEVATLRLRSGQKMPFKVHFSARGKEGTVEVLGTHFNVNAYEDEPLVKATLLQGSVMVTRDAASAVIKPGEQVQLNLNKVGSIKVQQNVDVEEAVAWKNGSFYFNGADIETIMRQVARWYDVDIVYKGKIPEGHFRGNPSRNLTASQMLKVVAYSGVKFSIEGNKIIVKE